MRGFAPADIRATLEILSLIGSEHCDAEVVRVRAQRELFRGGRVEEYLRQRGILSVTGSEEE